VVVAVSLAIVSELEPVFQVAQKAVGRNQPAIFGGRQKIFIVKPRQAPAWSRHAAPKARPAVQTLQTLHQKFDIADASGSQLDVECRFSQTAPVQFFR